MFIVIFTALIVLLVSGNVISLYTDWLWFGEIGQVPVFTTVLGTEIKLGVVLGLAFFLALYASLTQAHRYRSAAQWHRTEQWMDLAVRAQLDPYVSRLIPSVAMVIAFFVGVSGAVQWENYLLFADATPFGRTDPVFGIDYSFFVFRLPFLSYLQGWSEGMLFLILLLTAVLYVYHGGIGATPRGIFVDPVPKRHLLALVALILVLKGIGYRLTAYDLLHTTRGIVTGAVYADIHARIPALNVLAVLAVLTAIAVAAGGFTRGWRLPLSALVVLLVVSVVGETFYPELLHRFRVQPNEIELEKPYILENIKATRYAYGLNNIVEKEFPAEENLTLRDLEQNHLTVKNIRLWDHRPLLSTYRQLQQIRTYYDFVDVDNDRYQIDGEYRQVMLSPRELSYQNLPGGANWINEHLTYTHGYGLALGPVNQISKEGLPEFMIKDIPPKSTVDISVNRPELYYNELANDYVFVDTKAKEFDYPIGDENKYTHYGGKGGVRIGSWLNKLVFAVHFGSIKILLSNDIGPDSRVMYFRNIMERVRRLAPFLMYDRDPYIVVTKAGRLVWIVDGYTDTDRIPYSQTLAGVGNYVRNSVKGVVDAYDGTVTLYVNDDSDPIIKAYEKIFPGLFQPPDRMPAEIRAHLRYPQDLFTVQSHLYATYHMQDPQIFYNREDLWNIPKKDERDMEPYYTIMKLPGETKEEFILLIPYTPARRDNMAAWMAARADGDNYGKLVVFVFPKDKLIYGPRQIEARIDQDGNISQQITLWSQRGSQVIRGNLLVIPIKNSLLYVEPLYLAAESGSLPELRRVIVAYGNQLSMEPNLETALGNIFGKMPVVSRPSEAPPEEKPAGAPPTEGIREALDHFEKAQSLLKQGDFAGYGREIQAVETILKRLSKENR
jgi:uncharacterized membrane protein (UPF0182 family)